MLLKQSVFDHRKGSTLDNFNWTVEQQPIPAPIALLEPQKFPIYKVIIY